MSERTDRDFLEHIREAAERASSYTEKMTSEEFLGDTKTQDAIIRNIEIIGEATKNLSDDLRDRHPEIPWKGLAGMRETGLYISISVSTLTLFGVWQKMNCLKFCRI